jgi:putative urate catabolism protein
MMPERDLIGYGGRPPHPRWPNDARVAVQFVLNIEEGAELSVVNHDQRSESYLHELPGRPPRMGERDLSVESMYEYGSRAGVWRILDLFDARNLPLTAFVVGKALELNPDLGEALSKGGHEVAGHGYRWIDYHGISEKEERQHIQLTVEIIERFCGKRPVGWYTGRVSQNTRHILREHGGFLYTSDAYNDDLPYWLSGSPPLLVVPYTLVNNDARYLLPAGFSSGFDFFQTLKDGFDLLWQEGAQSPKMMSVGLHARISGHPARAMALARFLDYVQKHDAVWICRRADIAQHWLHKHPPSKSDATEKG